LHEQPILCLHMPSSSSARFRNVRWRKLCLREATTHPSSLGSNLGNHRDRHLLVVTI
jgi:hypothetical protein